jgi:hypothetical protein
VTNARFFTAADAPYFAGTVALLNSLRLTGHEHELVVLDRGLTGAQREALVGHVTLFDLPDERTVHPNLVKPFPTFMELHDVVALIDSDMIVTTSLEPILEQAAAGKICAFPNHYSAVSRRYEAWSELFDLAAPLRSQTYLNAGFVGVSVEYWPTFFHRWWKACERAQLHAVAGGDPEVVAQWDQDALNAILMSEVPREAVEILPAYEWHLDRVEIEDERTLRCRVGDELQPLLHTPRTPKVWQPGGWRHVEYQTRAYVSLMPRVLFGRDVALRLSPSEVPYWLRPGRLSRLCASAIRCYNGLPDVLRRARRAPRRALRETRQLVTRLRTPAARRS